MNVIHIKGAHAAPKADRNSMETMLLTPDVVSIKKGARC